MPGGIVVGSSTDGEKRFTLFFGRLPVFSNFYYSPFNLDGRRWMNTEQYFQYMKAEHFNDKEVKNKIIAAHTPDEQKKLGRKVKNYNEADWSNVREDVMLKGSIAKVRQYCSKMYTKVFECFSFNKMLKKDLSCLKRLALNWWKLVGSIKYGG